MIDFKSVKSLVTAREAAEHYGLTVNSHGMAVCPFHDDHNPSMKLDEHRFPVSRKSLRIWHDLSPPGACAKREAEIPKAYELPPFETKARENGNSILASKKPRSSFLINCLRGYDPGVMKQRKEIRWTLVFSVSSNGVRLNTQGFFNLPFWNGARCVQQHNVVIADSVGKWAAFFGKKPLSFMQFQVSPNQVYRFV